MNFDLEETAYQITIINKTNNLKYYVWIYSSIHGATTGLQSMHTTSTRRAGIHSIKGNCGRSSKWPKYKPGSIREQSWVCCDASQLPIHHDIEAKC